MIGIFDSGSGGLTVLLAIRALMPSANIIYLGDIKNAPYGSKSRDELSALTVQAMEVLLKRDAKVMVSACNSLSASLAVSLFDVFDLDKTNLFEMVGPTVSFFKGSPERILLCATPATVESGIYQNAFKTIGKEIIKYPMQELAGLIEFGASKQRIKANIKSSFKGVKEGDFDVILLSCTHYPLVRDIFNEVLEEILPTQIGKLVLFDPAEEVARRIKENCWQQEIGDSTTKFLITKDSDIFRSRVDSLFPNMQYTIEIV